MGKKYFIFNYTCYASYFCKTVRPQSNDFWESDLAEADSWLTNLLMYFQLQSHSVFGEWTTISFDTVEEWAFPGSLPCTGCCHSQDKAVLLQTGALLTHHQNIKYLSSAANHSRRRKPTIINYTALLNSRPLFAKKTIIPLPLDLDETLHTNTCRTEQNVMCIWVHPHMCLLEHSIIMFWLYRFLNVRNFTS